MSPGTSAVRGSDPDRLPALGQDGSEQGASVTKRETGIAGFDEITMGGLPPGRATVVAGQAGSGKTVFVGQFLAEGIRRGESGVFVSLEEPVQDLRANLETLGHDIPAWEAANDWRFVDASPLVRLGPQELTVEPYRMETLTAQIGHAIDATGAQRLVLDSVNGVLALPDDAAMARQALRGLIGTLRPLGLAIMITVETSEDPQAMSSFGIEEFVADNVVLMHNLKEGRVRRRTIEVLKMRGAMHHKGEASFTVLPGRGVVVLPASRRPSARDTPVARITSGNERLDAMFHGGLFGASSTLVAGATGTGKTLIATEFLGGGVQAGERALLLAYDESHDQVMRNAAGWGHDFAAAQERDLLCVSTFYPEAASLDDHFVAIQNLVRQFRPARVAVDSLSALERLGTAESYREFVTRLTAFFKSEGIATLVTLASAGLPIPDSDTEAHIAALADAIVLLRHVEVDSAMRRAVLVLKMRGSAHDEQIRSFTITETGMQVGDPFAGVAGVLTAR